MKHLYITLTLFFFTALIKAGNSFSCPTVTLANQSFCENTNPTIADLSPSDVLWYASNDPGSLALSGSTSLTDSMVYYAGDLAETCTARPSVSVSLTAQANAGNDKFTEICDADTQALFPALYSIDNYYKAMLDPGVPGNGTFSPNARQMSEAYQASDIDGYKDFTTTYTIGSIGCQDSVDLTIRVNELKKAGDDIEITLFANDSVVNLFDYLVGDPTIGGTWSVLGDGIFNPSVDQPGDYTYTVVGCEGSDSSMVSVIIRPAVAPGCPKVIDINQSFCRSTFPGNKVKFLVATDNGGGIAWYADNTTTTALSPEALLVDGSAYYAGSIDGACAGNRAAVTVEILFSPNAGKTSWITLNSDDPAVDLRDLISQTEPGWPVDSGGYMVPNTKAGGTNFTPSLDGTWTGLKQTRHWVTGTAECPTDYTIVYLTINPAPNTSHRLYYIGNNEQDAEKYLNYYPPGSQEVGMKVNIWIDTPLEVGSVYKIGDNGTYKYYYVNNVYEDPDNTPDLTFTGDMDIIVTNMVLTVPDPTDPEIPSSIPEPEYQPYSGPVLSNENYVYSRTPRVGVTDVSSISSTGDVMENVSYFDGLGRLKQNVAIRGGGAQEDIITTVDYDGFGRQNKEYLPYASASQNGQIYPEALLETQAFYNSSKYENTLNPYSEKIFENSPLNRINQQAAPGADWAVGSGHEIQFGYHTNELDEVRLFKVVFTDGDYRQPSLEESGYYNAGELYKFITYDEEHDTGKNHSTEEFKDKQGRVVLKRTYATVLNEVAAHDTYYIYDYYGNITFVLPPKMEGSNSTLNNLQTSLPELGYQYEYDNRNRLVEKQIPGKGREHIVYNSLDQPVLTQDANQRVENEWLYTKYDAFGRVAGTGIYSHGSPQTQGQMEGVLNAYYTNTSNNLFEEKTGLTYTNLSFPTTGLENLTQNYYDDYNFDLSGLAIPDSIGNGTLIEKNKVQGLSTGSKVKVLGTQNWITSAIGYDKNGRAIWNGSENTYLETKDISEAKLDFLGYIINQNNTHSKNGEPDIIVRDSFTYDQMNRQLAHIKRINEEEDQVINYNYYDELGQLIAKDVGGEISGAPELVPTNFKDIVGVSIEENNVITKTAAVNAWGNAGLATENVLTGDGFMEGVLTTNSIRVMMGLSKDNPDANYNTIDYALYTYNGKLLVYENGANKGTFQNYVPGDTIRVERIGGSVYYKKNENIVYVSAVDQNIDLIGDMSFYTTGTSIENVSLETLEESSGHQPLQTVDYAYNIRGWLKQINDPTSLGTDLFGFKIGYNEGINPLYNGNIALTQWKTANTDSSLKTYDYTYDALNRITSATDNISRYNLSGMEYDKNGNITNLTRKGHIVANPVSTNSTDFGTMDVLSYNYETNSNKLINVTDAILTIPGDGGFKDGNKSGNDYTYDANGNMKIDANKGITGITYNHLNLPTSVTLPGGTISYIYDATGVKLEKVVTDGTTITRTKYAVNFIYNKTGIAADVLQFFNTPEGYVEYDGGSFNYVYQYKDVWGNNRLSYSDSNNDSSVNASEIIEEKNYYPFGLEHIGYNNMVNGTEHKFKFQNQEFTENLGLDLYEYKYRMHDPAIGRFMQIDPLAEDYTYNSTYAFQENKLGIGVELEGLEVSKHEWLDKKGRNHIDYSANIKVANNSSASQKDIISYAKDIANGISNDFSGVDADGNIVSTSVNLEFVNEIDSDSDFAIEFTDQVKNPDGTNAIAEGKADVIGNTEVNRMQVLIPGKSGVSYGESVTNERMATNGTHEYGHAVGLYHQVGSSNRSMNGIPVGEKNLMRSTPREGRQQGGVNGEQLKVLKNTVKNTYQVNQNKWNRQKAAENKRQRAGKF